MDTWLKILDIFLKQAHEGTDLKTSPFPRDWGGLKMRVSFGMGAPARVPWIAFIAPEMQVSKGFYPVYLFYKELGVLILAYGVSETEEFGATWPADIMNSTTTISAFFDKDIPRYGDSFVFKAYKLEFQDTKIQYSYFDTKASASDQDIESDLGVILDYYKKLYLLNQLLQLPHTAKVFFTWKSNWRILLFTIGTKQNLGKSMTLLLRMAN